MCLNYSSYDSSINLTRAIPLYGPLYSLRLGATLDWLNAMSQYHLNSARQILGLPRTKSNNYQKETLPQTCIDLESALNK